MGHSEIFQICNTIVLPGWLALIFFQKWKQLHYLIFGLCLSLAVVYVCILFSSPSGSLDFGSLDSVKSLFENESALLAGWIHYLAFDLLVGYWIVRDAQRHEINRWIIIPSLFFTLMTGPFGFLTYMVIRTIKLKSLAT